MSDLIKHKFKAAGIHLGISVIIFIGILYLILVQWYPEPFFTAEGGWQGIRLMAFVDLVLGPSLTFIVYNHMKKKKEIFFDLSVIALIQLCALVWGGHTVYSKRPIALAYYEYAFFTVTADYYSVQGISHPQFTGLSDHIPPMVAVRAAESESEKKRMDTLLQQAIPTYAHDYLYVPVADQLEVIKNNQVDIQEIMQYNAEMKQDILSKTEGAVDGYIFASLQAKFHNVIIILNDQGEYVDMVKVTERS